MLKVSADILYYIHFLVFRRKLGWTDENTVTKTLADFWVIFQPILFGLIGTEIQVSELDPNTVGNNFWILNLVSNLYLTKLFFLGLGIAVLVISISFRLVVSYLAVLGGDLNIKERIFISMAWLPKGWYFMSSTKKIVSFCYRFWMIYREKTFSNYDFSQFLRAGKLLLPFWDTVSARNNWENKEWTLGKPWVC